MAGSGCFTEPDLRAFALGELPASLAEAVARHLEGCPDCEARVGRWDDLSDLAIRALRRADRGRADLTVSASSGRTRDGEPISPPESLPEAFCPAGFTVLEELGRGGAGVVYRARQHQPDRVVALKCLLGGAYSEAEQRARFRAEADAIARLNHPHIVQVYAAGEHDGRPFLCLEYLTGGSLAATLGGRPQPPREAARLVQLLASAVQHAHERGVVHRDLKPANVLLAADGTPKVTDFGLARFGRPELTATGAILGTPSYMAPEQARGDNAQVGPAADVWALGVILYECLTGQPPFRGVHVLDTLELVVGRDPVPPARLLPGIPRDLNVICLKCLHKQPARRYATAAALGDDLRRFLAGEPIHARPTPAYERAAKWARRSPAKATLLVCSVFALVGLVAGILWHTSELGAALALAQANEREAVKQKGEAQKASGEAAAHLQTALREKREAEQARGKARARFLKARQAVDEMLTEVGDRNLAQMRHMFPLRKTLLEKALAFNKEFLRESTDDPDLLGEVALAHKRAGNVQEMLGDLKQARTNYRQAIDLFGRLAAAAPDNTEHQVQLALCWNRLSDVCRQTADSHQAEEALRKALATQRALTRRLPGDRHQQKLLAAYQNNWGLLMGDLGKPAEAEQAHRDALEIMERLIAAEPKEDYFRRELANCCNHVAVYAERKRAFSEAESLHRRALALQGQLVASLPHYPFYRDELAGTWQNLARTLARMRRPEETVAAFQKAVEQQKRLVMEFDSVPRFHEHLALILANFGLFLNSAGKLDDAEKTFREAVAVSGKLVAVYAPVRGYQSRHGGSCNNLAMVLLKKNRPREARSWLETAVRHQTLAYKSAPNNPQYRGYLRNHYFLLAQTCLRLCDTRAAAEAAVKLPELAPAGHSQYLIAARFLASCAALTEADPSLAEKERKARAQTFADRAMDHLQKAVQRGFASAETLRSSPDFSSLRQRADFQQVLTDLSMR
jgi:tetratricopeptide (TPR) repeat protein/anti-sigma factor RsiW